MATVSASLNCVSFSGRCRMSEREGYSFPQDWIEDCQQWRGRLLTGRYAHWCMEWDDLPIDETCPEWPCGCGIEDTHVE